MIKHKHPNIFEKIGRKLAELIEKFDTSMDESAAFHRGEYCNERKVFLKEIRIMKVLLCVDMLCTIVLCFVVLGR